MSRRIEVELTSTRDDGTWTWRAAGAKQPKGELDGSLLYEGAKVGDVVRADADFLLDGIVITGVLPPKGTRKEPERLEVLGPPRRDDQLVTTTLAPRGRGGRDGDRRGRGEGDRGRGRDGDRRGRAEGDRGREGDRRERRPRSDRPRPERPAPEPKPKPKRLRPGRTHRNAVLAELPEEQKPVAEQVLRGGIPAVRQAVDKQNEENRAEGKPEINAGPLLALAEQLVPSLRTAEWRDRAEAALADVAELDLRDLRSVVVAADAAARDEETRQLAEQLRTALTERVDAEHAAWLAEIGQMLDEGRAVRALRLSSRPPKAGTPFPPELATRLTEAASASLTSETGQDRYATVLDALAYSPVRGQVTAQGRPAEPSEALMAAVRKLAGRIPQVAKEFGVEAPAQPARTGRGRPKAKARKGAVPNPLGDRSGRGAGGSATPASPPAEGDAPSTGARDAADAASAPADTSPEAASAESGAAAAVADAEAQAPGAEAVPAEALDAPAALDTADAAGGDAPPAAEGAGEPSPSAVTDPTAAPSDATDGSTSADEPAATPAEVPGPSGVVEGAPPEAAPVSEPAAPAAEPPAPDDGAEPGAGA